MTAALKVGIVGYGYAGKTFHAPLIAGVPGLQLVAVSSSDAARVHADWPGLDVHDTPAALIARTDIDLIVIATPNATHFALAQAALQAGKHVVVDKPFTLTLHEAGQLEALATLRDRVLSVFHNRRWDGDFITVQRLITGGELGRITHFESRFDRFRPAVRARWRESAEPGAGLWFDLGPHLLDQALQLFGWPQALGLDAAALRDGALSDDWCMATLHYDRLRVTLHASMLQAACDWRYAVHGTRGSYVKLGLDRQEDALKAGRRPPWPAPADWGVDTGRSTVHLQRDDVVLAEPWPLARGSYGDYYAALARAIAGTAPNPVPPAQAMAVMALIELGHTSQRERRVCDAGPAPQGSLSSVPTG